MPFCILSWSTLCLPRCRLSGPGNLLNNILSVKGHMSHLMTKPTKWHVRPAKTQMSLVIRPVWSVFAVCMKKAWVLSYPLSAQQRLWSDWVDAQADLSLRWAHSHFVGFVMRRLNYNLSFQRLADWGFQKSHFWPSTQDKEHILVLYEYCSHNVNNSSVKTNILLHGAIIVKFKLFFLSCKVISGCFIGRIW